MTCPFQVEEIPPEDLLYRRIKNTQLDEDGRVLKRFFENRKKETGLSTDWSKYSDPDMTRNRSLQGDRDPLDYGVISFLVGDVQKVPYQTVEHRPICNDPVDPDNPNNQAHAEIEGPKSYTDLRRRGLEPNPVDDVEIRTELSEMYIWVIPVANA